ncbi:PE domain-containing protein [Actinokineospora spheciospongiae]|uniref:PE domain-containing protein n=1 Tax=Actinokineospora spheciospongiae TaxID=909613 RepID=UPI000D7164B7|nr:PE domain-containing protein [Actinokineospora spheciospongiae]PWW61762.1 PE family protein [Actinokineospora spheciospongiae]
MDANPLGALGGVVSGLLGGAANLLDNLTHGTAPSSGGHFVVNHDNVLAAAKIIQSQVDELTDTFDSARNDLQVVPPGDDEVSRRMAEAWNDILLRNDDSYSVRVREYIEGLTNLVSQLKATAKDYGYNEEQITSALGGSHVV